MKKKINEERKLKILTYLAVLIFTAAAVLACVYLMIVEPSEERIANGKGGKPGKISFFQNTEKKIDKMIGGHEDEDYYTGVGGRSDTEEEINYIILKHLSAADDPIEMPEDPREPKTPGEEPETPGEEPETPGEEPETPGEEPETPGEEPETPGEEPETPGEEPETPGEEPETPGEEPEPVIDENWNDRLYEMLRDVEYETEFYTDTDVDKGTVFKYLKEDAYYRTGEDGIFWETYYMESEEKDGMLLWYVSVGYSREKDEILKIKVDTAEKEDFEVGQLDYNSLSEIEKVELINDFVCDYVEYHPGDPAKANDLDPYPDQSHNAYGALFEHLAVCNGYARLVKMMCDDMGVECRIIRGDVIGGGGHAWNLVKVDGQWYHLDVTWNDGGADRHDYFLIPDSYLDGDRDWNKEMYPEIATSPYYR